VKKKNKNKGLLNISTKDEYDSSGPHTHVHYKHLFLNILIISKHLPNEECSFPSPFPSWLSLPIKVRSDAKPFSPK